MLPIAQMRSEVFGKYVFASFMDARGVQASNVSKDALENTVLPILSTNKSDVCSQFLQAIYVDYDLDKAIQLVPKIHETASSDLFLKGFAAEIKKQALLLVFQTKCKLFRSVGTDEVTNALGKDGIADLQKQLQVNGFLSQVEGKSVSCRPISSDVNHQL